MSSAAVAHAGWAPSSTLSTTERAVIRLSVATGQTPDVLRPASPNGSSRLFTASRKP